MKRTSLTLITVSLALAFTSPVTAEEESEFSKHLQRKAADLLWEIGKEIFKEASKGSSPMVLTKPVLYANPGGDGLLGTPNFKITSDRLDNKTDAPIGKIVLAIWSCGTAYQTGQIDGVLLGTVALDDELQPGYGFPEFSRHISIDLQKAKQTQALKGRPQTIVLTVGGRSPADDKPYFKGWVNFSPYDFEKNTWVTSSQ